jgi:hypothetical protein
MHTIESTLAEDRATRLRQALLELLAATGPSGAPRFSAFDVRNCLTAMDLVTTKRLGERAEALSDDTARGLQRFLDVDAAESPEAAAARIGAHYREHPIDPALARAIEQLLRAFVRDESVEEASPRLARLLGTEAPRRPLPGGARPEGNAPAGPLARFRLQPIV